ncbi:MAG: RnfH family protein [Mariprofundaceae bacterium]
MKASLVYALPQEQYLEDLDVPDTTTVEQLIHMSRLLEHFPELNLSEHKVGVFAKLAKMDQPLHDGDRVEVYRSLPKKPRNAHASDDKKARIRAKKEKRSEESE